MQIKVLGTGCAKCKLLYGEAEKAVAAAGIPVDLAKIERIDEIMKFGVMMTPALVLDGEVKASGRVPKSAEIVNWIATRSSAKQLVFCPTYYTPDPVLETLYGKMPEGYLGELGAGLDKKVSVFWTGEKVCSGAYTPEHLKDTAGKLGRKPFLWDNYPVNDGPRMCKFLHLRAVTGRPPAIGFAASASLRFSPTISGWLQVKYGFGPAFMGTITLYTISVIMYWAFFWRRTIEPVQAPAAAD